MININPREVAAAALNDIRENSAYNNMTLRRYLRQNGAMPRVDKAFVTECVNGTLRNMIFIDYVINIFSKTKTNKLKPFILSVNLYNIFYLKLSLFSHCMQIFYYIIYYFLIIINMMPIFVIYNIFLLLYFYNI